MEADMPQDFWLFNLILNLSTYAVLVLPAALAIQHLHQNAHILGVYLRGVLPRTCCSH